MGGVLPLRPLEHFEHWQLISAPPLMAADCICKGRTGCIGAGRTEATGFRATGRIACTVTGAKGRVAVGRCAGARADFGGKSPQRRSLCTIRRAVRG